MDKGKVSGKAAMNAALVLVSMCIRFGIEINYTLFLKGLDNHQADRLSRIIEKGMTMEQAMEMNGHKGAEVVDLSDNLASRTLVDMCDPGRRFESDIEFREVWVAIREAVEGV
jgi:hypothetical protein